MTKRDLARFDALRAMGCIAGIVSGKPCYGAKIEIHHLVDKGYRKLSGGNQATLPLCIWHHRGEPPMDFTASFMREHCGPSMQRESKVFALTYGTQRELLALVDSMLSIGKIR